MRNLLGLLLVVCLAGLQSTGACPSAFGQLENYNRAYGPFVAWELSVNLTKIRASLVSHYFKVRPIQSGDPPAVLVLPTNAAFHKWIGKNGLRLHPSKWGPREVALLHNASIGLVVPWRTANRRWPKYFTGCNLLGLTHDIKSPLDAMGLDLWNGKGPGLSGSLLHRVKRPAPYGRHLSQAFSNPSYYFKNYSIAGFGYNTLTGFPLDFTGNDPGITYNPVFNTGFNGVQVSSVSNWTTCSVDFATTTYYTAAQMQSAGVSMLQMPSRYASAAFSQNSYYAGLASNMAASSMITLSQRSIVTGGGWSLGPAISAISPLDSNYVTAVNNLASAKMTGSSNYSSLLSTFANSYGSTYVQQVWWGSFVNTMLQYTPSNYAAMQQALPTGVSISTQALGLFYSAGGYIITSGCYPYNTNAISTIFQKASNYKAMQVPYCNQTTNTLSAVPISSSGPPGSTYSTGCTGGSINCPGWTNNMLLQEQQTGIQAPNSYFLADQYNLLTGSPYLFASSVQSTLPSVANDLANYFSKCSSPAPCPTPSSCPSPPGSFSYSGSCVLCYDNTNPNSPLCTSSYLSSCGIGTCACPTQVPNIQGTTCPPVAPPLPAPAPNSCTCGSSSTMKVTLTQSSISATYLSTNSIMQQYQWPNGNTPAYYIPAPSLSTAYGCSNIYQLSYNGASSPLGYTTSYVSTGYTNKYLVWYKNQWGFTYGSSWTQQVCQQNFKQQLSAYGSGGTYPSQASWTQGVKVQCVCGW